MECRAHLLRLNELADGRGDLVFHLAKVEASLGNRAGRDGMACDPFEDGVQDVRFCRRFGLRCAEKGNPAFLRIELAARGVHYSIRNQTVFRQDAGPREESIGRPGDGTLGGVSGKPVVAERSYPTGKFEVFWDAAKGYAELTRSDPLIHRAVAAAVNGLVDFLEAERKSVPAGVLRDAERLECLLFSGYDPFFEGDEPPGL